MLIVLAIAAIVVACLAISGYLIKLTRRFVKNYDGPEYYWAGSGTAVGLTTFAISGLVVGACCLIAALV